MTKSFVATIQHMFKEYHRPSRTQSLFPKAAIVLLALLFLLHAENASAQASLASEDIIDSLQVGNDSFTVVRDALQRDQWYYVPDRPRLFERKFGDAIEPEFQLLKYQFNDPKNPQQIIEGGILQFSATLDLPADVQQSLRKQIADKRPDADAKTIRLAALPLKSAQVAVYAVKDGTLISGDAFGSGNAPTIASQKMIFSIPLTQIGADVYDALVKGNTGVPVSVALTYGGLAPPVGFTVHVDWDLTYDHYSKDEKFAARASYYGLWGASVSAQRQEVYDDLVKSNAIKVDIIPGSDFKMDEIDKYLQPILARINAEMIDNMKPPDKINPAQAPDPSTGGWFGGAGYSVSVKKQHEHRTGKEDISFNVRQYEERVTAAGGFIGIGQYPPALQAKLITTVPAGSWDKAFFLLPTMFNDPRLEIETATFQLGLTDGSSDFDSLLYSWSPTTDWTNNNIPVKIAAMSLAGLKAKIGDQKYKDLNFKTKLTLVHGETPINIESRFPVFDGQRAIGSLPELFERVGIDAQGIAFNQLSSSSLLDTIDLKISSGGNTCTDTIRPRITDGKYFPPNIVYCLFPQPAAATSALPVQVVFTKTDGSTVQWKHNGDLRKDPTILNLKDIVLRNSDWK